VTIVDSSIWIDYFADRATLHVDWVERHMDVERLGLTDLILYEVLQGAKGDARFSELHDTLHQFEIWPNMQPGLAILSARNYRELRRRGVTVRKTIDCLIATFCIEGDHELLHNDHDFDGFEEHLGLRVIHPRLQ
jgi:predicted nucleic acid-binding protein